MHMFTAKMVVGTFQLYTGTQFTHSSFLDHNPHYVQTRAAVKNYRTDRFWIRESEATQKDNLYHISGTQYTLSSVRYIFHIYTTRQNQEIMLFQPLSHLCTPHQRNQSNDIHVCNIGTVWKNYFPCSIFQCTTLIHSTTKVAVLTRTGQSVGLQKGHITNLWQYGGKQPLSSEYRPSSSGLSDQHRQLHQAHHIWPWHWSCKRLSQESTEPHSMP